MNVTEVRISPAKGGKVKAFASIVIDDCFIVNDLRVMEGREGQVFVTMPARKSRNGQMRDIAHAFGTSQHQLPVVLPLSNHPLRFDRKRQPGLDLASG